MNLQGASLCLLIACWWSMPVHAQTLDETAAMAQRSSLADRVQSGWPDSGAILLEYSNFNQKNHLQVGYDFSSGAWFRIWQFKMISGIDPSGVAYDGSATLGEPSPRDAVPGASWLMDAAMPQIGLVDILRDERWPVRIEQKDEGLWVTASLPRGSRMPVEHLAAAEIDRWGGQSEMLRDVVFVLRDDLSVASRTRPTSHKRDEPKYKTEEFDVASCSPDGFQVVQTHPPPGEMVLTHCALEHAESSRLFEQQSVVARAIATRVENPEVTPVVSAAQADESRSRPTPIGSGSSSIQVGRAALVGAGLMLVGLGLAALWIRRRASRG